MCFFTHGINSQEKGGALKWFTGIFPGIFQNCGQSRKIVNEQIVEMAVSAERSLW